MDRAGYYLIICLMFLASLMRRPAPYPLERNIARLQRRPYIVIRWHTKEVRDNCLAK